MARRANVSNWGATKIDRNNIDIKVPADDILGERRADGKRPFKLPMYKIIAKLREKCPKPQKHWDYTYVDLNQEGTTLTFRMSNDG